MKLKMALALLTAACSLGAVQAQTPLPAAMATELATAGRVLVNQGVIDVRGHVSVRDPANPNAFWISRSVAPGLATPADLQEFDLEGKQIGGAAGESFAERFIHARIYAARSDVKSVVHAHTPSLTTFSVSGIPLRPVMLAGVFSGDGVPVIRIGPSGEGGRTLAVGEQIAKALGDKTAVLMGGHGAVIVGPSIQSAIGRSVGLDQNAQMQITLLSMGATPQYLTPPAGVGQLPGDYAREWSWWVRQLETR